MRRDASSKEGWGQRAQEAQSHRMLAMQGAQSEVWRGEASMRKLCQEWGAVRLQHPSELGRTWEARRLTDRWRLHIRDHTDIRCSGQAKQWARARFLSTTYCCGTVTATTEQPSSQSSHTRCDAGGRPFARSTTDYRISASQPSEWRPVSSPATDTSSTTVPWPS